MTNPLTGRLSPAISQPDGPLLDRVRQRLRFVLASDGSRVNLKGLGRAVFGQMS